MVKREEAVERYPNIDDVKTFTAKKKIKAFNPEMTTLDKKIIIDFWANIKALNPIQFLSFIDLL